MSIFAKIKNVVLGLMDKEGIELTSLDYAELLKFAAYKYHKTILNRTQINKILYYAYGIYLADNDDVLFKDDQPKAWPYGPVFPKVNKKINPSEIVKSFPKEKNDLFKSNVNALIAIKEAVDKLYNKTAYKLTQWTHVDGSPWYQTVFPDDGREVLWNTPIDNDKIKKYFSVKENRNVR